jgi:pimeloyl-ACP methyl ester carboxylesterase
MRLALTGYKLTLAGMMSAVTLLGAVRAAAQQQYYTPATGGTTNNCTFGGCSSTEIGPATHYITDNFVGTNCSGPFDITSNFKVTWGTLTTLAGLQLLESNGQWVPQTVTGTGPTSVGWGQSTYISAVSAGGLVTTSENGSWDNTQSGGNGTGTSISTETLDLNTGKYTWHRVINETFGAGCAGSGTETQNRTATLPVVPLEPFTPQWPFVSLVNPFAAGGALALQAPSSFPDNEVPSSPTAIGLSADGISAAVVVIRSTSNAPVALTLSAPGLTCPCAGTASFGSLAPYTATFLSNPVPSGTTQLTVSPYITNLDGTYTFLALLWSPPTMPVPTADLQSESFQGVGLNVSATQASITTQTSITLQPPPLLLVHGIWSSPAAWDGFFQFLGLTYPHNLIQEVDYSRWNAEDFGSSDVQGAFFRGLTWALVKSASQGVVARRVDVVAHSMGGLVTRYFMNAAAPGFQGTAIPSNNFLTSNPIHTLITVGTPHLGSPLASTFENNLNQLPLYNTANLGQLVQAICASKSISSCTLQAVLGLFGKSAGTGVISLEPGSNSLGMLKDANDYQSIIGVAPPPSATPPLYAGSATEGLLDVITEAYTNQTDPAIIDPDGIGHDTIVGYKSQQGSSPSAVGTIAGIVHTALVPSDTDETESTAVWSQALCWLMTGSGTPVTCGSTAAHLGYARQHVSQTVSSTSIPILDLTGYSQTPASNVSFTPATGSTLAIDSVTAIGATSATKTITALWLLQQVGDPTDSLFLYSAQSPFAISFTPTRMGSTTFVAFALFSDMTYAVTTLSYTFQPNGNAEALELPDAPAGSLLAGASTVVHAQAEFSSGPVDVSQQADYSARSGGSSVFTIGSGGLITGSGNGVDWLDVTYGGFTSSAQIAVGSCSYALTPLNQFVDVNGGTVSIQVTTTTGCAWTADSGNSTWLSLSNATGSGSGVITATAAANTSGATQTGIITVGGQDVAITQPGTSCTYALSPTQVSAPSTGVSGSITVNTSCPIVTSSSASWLTAVPLASGVNYAVSANTGSGRSASLTIGNQTVSVIQAAAAAAPAIQLSAASNSLTISAPGGSTTAAIQVAGVQGFSGSVSLACTVTFQGTGTATGLPTCSLSPAQGNVTSSSSLASMLSVSTTAQGTATNLSHFGLQTFVAFAALPFIALLPRRKWPTTVVFLLALAAMTVISGCGGGSGPGGGNGNPASNPGTTTGSYQVVVTATSGSLQASTNISLTVQ